jgi:hypothetical protein
MLLVTYYATCPKTHAQLDGDALYCHPSVPPFWLGSLGEPAHTMPVDAWSSLQGDSNNVIHMTGYVSYWHGDSSMIDRILQLQEPTAVVAQREQLEQICRTHPGASYVVRVERRTTRSVSRQDREFQDELQKAIADDDACVD